MDSFINYQVEVYDNGYYSGPSNVQSILVLNKPTLQLKKKNRTITAISVPKTNMKGGKLKCEFLFSKNKNFKKCVKMKGQLKSNKSKSFYESILKNFKKNKKYYVKARLVFTKGNKKYYSDYSKVKTFKFK